MGSVRGSSALRILAASLLSLSTPSSTNPSPPTPPRHPPHLPRGFSPPQSGGLPSPNNPISEPGHAPPITKTRLGKLTNHKARCIRAEGDQVRLFKSRLDHLEGFHTNDVVKLSNKKNQYQHRGSKQSHMPHCTEIKIKTRTNYKHKQKYKRRVNHGKYSLSRESLSNAINSAIAPAFPLHLNHSSYFPLPPYYPGLCAV